jgi:hypothetical protein
MSDANHSPQFDAVGVRSAVITVGGGRGFVVMGKRRIGEYYVTDEYVITAAHCLPHLPPCHACSYTEERTYEGLLAPLGGEPAVWAECLFADPVGDIAVLRSPDGQWNPEAGETLRSGKFSATWTLACTGCGCGGGPGYRGPDGKCVGWQNIEAVFELSDVERFVWI